MSWIKEQKKGKKEEKQVGIELVCILYKHYYYLILFFITMFQGCHGRDRMVVGIKTTLTISAYHH